MELRQKLYYELEKIELPTEIKDKKNEIGLEFGRL